MFSPFQFRLVTSSKEQNHEPISWAAPSWRAWGHLESFPCGRGKVVFGGGLWVKNSWEKDQEAEVVGFFAWHSFWVMEGISQVGWRFVKNYSLIHFRWTYDLCLIYLWNWHRMTSSHITSYVISYHPWSIFFISLVELNWQKSSNNLPSNLQVVAEVDPEQRWGISSVDGWVGVFPV